MNLYAYQFLEEHDFPSVESPSKVLIIASTPRCGSHMLGHTLYSTGAFGFPLEYANPKNLVEWKKRLQTNSFHETLEEIQHRRTSPNGVFSIKMHYSHIKQFGGFEKVKAFFPGAYYVLLGRKNILRQAVSYSLALQTGVWINGQKPIKSTAQYDYNHINRCFKRILRDYASWRYVIEASGCKNMELDFDYAVENMAEAIGEISSFLEVDVDTERMPYKPETRKQSSNVNEVWAKQFIQEYNGDLLFESAAIGIEDKLFAKVKAYLGIKRPFGNRLGSVGVDES